MNILGISAFYHDSAAALLMSGDLVAAAQEERFTRKKHDSAFPLNAIKFCLETGNIPIQDIDYVVFYDKPLLKFDRLLETYLTFAPRGYASFIKAIPVWLKEKLGLRRKIKESLGAFKRPLVFIEHHESHAASAYYPSPYNEAAIITIDGVGEWATASIGWGKGREIKLIKTMNFPHSLGLLYSAFTYYCGFKVNSGEYKLMGLAPYGKPVFQDLIVEKLMRLHEDGSIWMDMSYFNYAQGLTMTTDKFNRLFGGPPRNPETDLTLHHMNIAASIQAVTESIMLRMSRYAREITGLNKLCLAGGVALNCVANGKILRSGEFDDVWIQPAAGDAGGALGGAYFVWHQLLEKPRTPILPDAQKASYLGPAYNSEAIREDLHRLNAKWQTVDNESELLEIVSQAMIDGKVVGWFCGRMEFGPRALGARSIIGDARHERMQSIMNVKIKFRESFRPFAPCVLREDVAKYFELDSDSPYMLLVADVLPVIRRDLTPQEQATLEDPDLRKRVNVLRSTIPAVTHVDYSARIQTVDAERHGRFYRLMKRFKEKTDCSVIINTSFNIRGEPIVNTPEQAYNCFIKTDMDLLVLENHILFKTDQVQISEADREAYRQGFTLD